MRCNLRLQNQGDLPGIRGKIVPNQAAEIGESHETQVPNGPANKVRLNIFTSRDPDEDLVHDRDGKGCDEPDPRPESQEVFGVRRLSIDQPKRSHEQAGQQQDVQQLALEEVGCRRV